MALTRRRAVLTGVAVALLGPSARAATAPAALRLGPARPFSFALLSETAGRLAASPYRPRAHSWASRLQSLDFDALGAIRFRPEAALWPGDRTIGTVEFFHLGRYASQPVAIHLVEAGQAQEILYGPDLFDIPEGSPARQLPPDIGFAGFRVLNPAAPGDWIAYLGASYFRSGDPFNQYGLSARGLAIDTAVAGPEEFPAFTAFWLSRDAQGLLVHALLEGPSVVGAYRIAHRRGPRGLTQEIEARLHFRRDVGRLGVAPLTSMYWYGQDERGPGADWRPAVHDSDGLALATGSGERIWRPLANPPRVVVNAFQDQDPKGFGLMQRDRTFSDYQDDGAFYDRRPSAWVEPLDRWGQGSVQLVEIPTDSETNDNIVAFWTPGRQARKGDGITVRYRLHWIDREDDFLSIGRVVATRTGPGGRPGLPPRRDREKVVIDFAGGALPGLGRGSHVAAVVSASTRTPIEATAYPIVGTGRWRLMFDIDRPKPGETTDLRAFLRADEAALTETWIGQLLG